MKILKIGSYVKIIRSQHKSLIGHTGVIIKRNQFGGWAVQFLQKIPIEYTETDVPNTRYFSGDRLELIDIIDMHCVVKDFLTKKIFTIFNNDINMVMYCVTEGYSNLCKNERIVLNGHVNKNIITVVDIKKE